MNQEKEKALITNVRNEGGLLRAINSDTLEAVTHSEEVERIVPHSSLDSNLRTSPSHKESSEPGGRESAPRSCRAGQWFPGSCGPALMGRRSALGPQTLTCQPRGGSPTTVSPLPHPLPTAPRS